MLGVIGIGIVSGVALIGVAYSQVKVPDANKAVKIQNSTLYYSDGKTVLAKLGDTDRQIVPLTSVAPAAQNAVLAAEDMGFRSESGFSVKGIARAAINDISGGSEQGGSTITQQLVKNEYLNQERTFTRKFKELFISVKIAHQQSHDKILTDYLNTVFFGRNAYGIQAASQAYYGVNSNQLTVPQAAILAANIKQPGYYDPALKTHHTDTVERYDYVLTNMVRMKVVSQADATTFEQQGPPMTKKLAVSPENAGQRGFLISRSVQALHNMKFTDQELDTLGLHITTTWNKKLQKQAAQTVEAKEKALHLASNIRIGLVCEDPKTGEILAAYGGKDFLKRQVDDAFYAGAQVGSSFKPYVLATALEQGIGLKSTFNPTSPQWFTPNGDSVPEGTPEAMHVTNDEGPAKGSVNLLRATASSLNTVYVPLGFKAGEMNVERLAAAAGLPPASLEAQDHVGGFFLGQSDMPPLYQASGYSTFANDGTYIAPHTIKEVTLDKKPFRKDTWTHKGKSVIPPNVVSNVDEALHTVVEPGGTAYPNAAAGLDDRNIAGKTGTTNGSAAAWFVGYTPNQMVTAVGMWRYTDAKGKKAGGYGDLGNVPGFPGGVMGGSIPAEIWNNYMTGALQGKKVTPFPTVQPVGTATPFYTPPPIPSSAPSTPPTCDKNSQLGADNKCHRKRPTPCIPTPLNNNCGSPNPGHSGTPPTCGKPFQPQCSGNPNPGQNNSDGDGLTTGQTRQEAARPPEG